MGLKPKPNCIDSVFRRRQYAKQVIFVRPALAIKRLDEIGAPGISVGTTPDSLHAAKMVEVELTNLKTVKGCYLISQNGGLVQTNQLTI